MSDRLQPPEQEAAVMAPLIVPNSDAHGTLFFSRVLDRSVRSTISNIPYAPVTNIKTAMAGPHAPPTVCKCGRSNPDNCVTADKQMTSPYLESTLSKSYMLYGFGEAPAVKDTPSPVETYLRNRVAPYP